MTEEQFLDKYVFYGLTNRNDGFDTLCIRHFCAADFSIILKRARICGVIILGTECWSGGKQLDVKYIEDYVDNNTWSSLAFDDMRREQDEHSCLFSATYDAPTQVLARMAVTEGGLLQSAYRSWKVIL